MATYEYPVNLTWPGSGSPGVNVWHFRADTPTGAEVQDCVDVIQGFYQDLDLGSVMTSGLVATGGTEAVDVQDSSIVPVSTWTQTYTTAGVPAFSAPTMVCLTLATSTATRSGRGRKFLGPVGANNASDDGSPVPGCISTVLSAGQALVSASQGLTLAAIGVYSPTEQLFRDLVSVRVRDTFAILRSRRD